ncbi:MAG: Na+/H+ antiporter NhaA [Actinomycetales bacterium]|nr:Na+/H+ antiporter NhaA [Actinomycetales bacterium]
MPATDTSRRIFARLSLPEGRFLARALRTETVGGALLLGAALLALIWSNSPWHESYSALRAVRIGPAGLHLDLSLGEWAADGLLAIFFLVAGIELKREFIAGDLSDRAKAAVPITAAVAGVALPAALYAGSVTFLGGDSDALAGWAIPTATDIAFALAVLAVIGSNLPPALRSFLLTLAVVDDLIAITIIAVFYTSSLAWLPLLGAAVPIAVFGWMLRRRMTNPALLAIPAVLAWGLVHAAGVHATVAGVLLGLAVPVNRREELAAAGDDDRHTLAETLEHALRPFSAGVAVPVFAFFAAGVRFVGGGLEQTWRDPVAIGIVVGLTVGKAVGVFTATWAVARFTRAELDEGLAWLDVLGLAFLSGLGFTVSLLIGELAYGAGSDRDDHVKIAVLVGSLLAAVCAAIILTRRDGYYRALAEHPEIDEPRNDHR